MRRLRVPRDGELGPTDILAAKKVAHGFNRLKFGNRGSVRSGVSSLVLNKHTAKNPMQHLQRRSEVLIVLGRTMFAEPIAEIGLLVRIHRPFLWNGTFQASHLVLLFPGNV